MYMYKFGFIFQNYISVARCMGQSETITGQTGLNKKKDKAITNLIS